MLQSGIGASCAIRFGWRHSNREDVHGVAAGAPIGLTKSFRKFGWRGRLLQTRGDSGPESTRRESEQRFRHITDEAPVMVWMSGAQALHPYFNQLLAALTGPPSSASWGMEWADGVHPERLGSAAGNDGRLRYARQNFENGVSQRRFDGNYERSGHGMPRFRFDRKKNFLRVYIGRA